MNQNLELVSGSTYTPKKTITTAYGAEMMQGFKTLRSGVQTLLEFIVFGRVNNDYIGYIWVHC